MCDWLEEESCPQGCRYGAHLSVKWVVRGSLVEHDMTRIRRFDPWGGVSRHMIEAEAKHVAREMQDYLLLSINDLKAKLSDRGSRWHHADEALHAVVMELPERDRVAVQCLLVRDMMFLLELYLEYVRGTQPEGPSPPPKAQTASVATPLGAGAGDGRCAPFSEWLFGG